MKRKGAKRKKKWKQLKDAQDEAENKKKMKILNVYIATKVEFYTVSKRLDASH